MAKGVHVTPPEGTRTFAVMLVVMSVVIMLFVLAVAMSGLFAVLLGEPFIWLD
jgi:hypothetical protein